MAYNSAIPWSPWRLTRWFKHWHGEKPARDGWYNTRVRGHRNSKGRRYWNGFWWSWPVTPGGPADDATTRKRQRTKSGVNISLMEWQGRHEQLGDTDWAESEPTGKGVYPDTD